MNRIATDSLLTTMSTFTPSHLGKWEALYNRLISQETMPLTEEMVWMVGNKPGLIAIMHDGEPIFIEGVKDIGKALSEYISGSVQCEFRTSIAISELGASPRSAAERAKKGPLADRINKTIRQYRFNVAPATQANVEKLAGAFRIVADPRFNGPTAQANAILDSLPR